MMPNLTKEYLHEILHYEPVTGLFTWKISPNRRIHVGDIAGNPDLYGYIRIGINGKHYKTHRLAWLYVYGKLPSEAIDHINGVRDDNRIVNLREATHAENMRNFPARKKSFSGVKGVYWHKATNKWTATCTTDGKRCHLGYFTNITEAEMAVRNIREKHHGEFTNHG